MATKKTRKPRQSTVPADETKSQKFVRLAEARLVKVVKMLRNLAKLGAPGYERTEQQAKKINEILTEEVNSVAVALKPGAKQAKEEVQFKL